MARTNRIVQQYENKTSAHTAPAAFSPPGETAQSGQGHGDEWLAEPLRVSSDEKAIQVSETSTDAFSSFPHFAEKIESEATETWEDSAEAEELARILLQDWNNFALYLPDKYPALFDPQAFASFAQTKEGRRELKSQAEGMMADLLNQLEDICAQLPPEVATESIRLAEEMLMQDNQGIPPKYLKQAFEKIRARLN